MSGRDIKSGIGFFEVLEISCGFCWHSVYSASKLCLLLATLGLNRKFSYEHTHLCFIVLGLEVAWCVYGRSAEDQVEIDEPDLGQVALVKHQVNVVQGPGWVSHCSSSWYQHLSHCFPIQLHFLKKKEVWWIYETASLMVSANKKENF